MQHFPSVFRDQKKKNSLPPFYIKFGKYVELPRVNQNCHKVIFMITVHTICLVMLSVVHLRCYTNSYAATHAKKNLQCNFFLLIRRNVDKQVKHDLG